MTCGALCSRSETKRDGKLALIKFMKTASYNTTDNDYLIDFKEVANRIGGVSIRSIYRLIARHELPEAVHVLSKPCLYASDVAAYLEKLKAKRSKR